MQAMKITKLKMLFLVELIENTGQGFQHNNIWLENGRILRRKLLIYWGEITYNPPPPGGLCIYIFFCDNQFSVCVQRKQRPNI